MIIRTPPKLTNRNSVIEFLEVKLWNWLRELTSAVLDITCIDNFQSFQVIDLEIKANTEISIFNAFKNSFPGVIPTSRIITRQNAEAIIIDGVQKWTDSHVFLKNTSMVNDVRISVIFFK